MGAFQVVRTTLHLLTCVILFIALIFLSLAAGRPDWQIMEPSDGQPYRHRHGLWEDCIHLVAGVGGLGVRNRGSFGQDRDREHDICKLKNFNHADPGDLFVRQGAGGLRQDMGNPMVTGDEHFAKAFQMTTLGLLLGGSFFVILALIFATVSSCADCLSYRPVFKCMAISWIVCHTLGVLLVASAMIVFASHSYDVKERSVKVFTEYIDQTWGASFWHGVTSVILLLISWIFAIVAVIGLFIMAGNVGRNRKYTYTRVERRNDGTANIPITKVPYDAYAHDQPSPGYNNQPSYHRSHDHNLNYNSYQRRNESGV